MRSWREQEASWCIWHHIPSMFHIVAGTSMNQAGRIVADVRDTSPGLRRCRHYCQGPDFLHTAALPSSPPPPPPPPPLGGPQPSDCPREATWLLLSVSSRSLLMVIWWLISSGDCRSCANWFNYSQRSTETPISLFFAIPLQTILIFICWRTNQRWTALTIVKFFQHQKIFYT